MRPVVVEQPVTTVYQYAPPPMTYEAGALYKISPERFAQIAQGYPLTQAEIDMMMGQSSPPASPTAAAEAPVAGFPSHEDTGKKKIRTGKKNAKGCCA